MAACGFTLVFAAPVLADFGFPPPETLTTAQGVTRAIVVTLVVEGVIVLIYARRNKLAWWKFVIALLLGNAITLPAVWFVTTLSFFFMAYIGFLVFLFVEFGAAMVEALVYGVICRLDAKAAWRLALFANVVTAGLSLVDQALNPGKKVGPPIPENATSQQPIYFKRQSASEDDDLHRQKSGPQPHVLCTAREGLPDENRIRHALVTVLPEPCPRARLHHDRQLRSSRFVVSRACLGVTQSRLLADSKQGTASSPAERWKWQPDHQLPLALVHGRAGCRATNGQSNSRPPLGNALAS